MPQIVILSYDHPMITARCVQSVLVQHPPEKCILVHNGSTCRHVEELRHKFPQIHHLELPQNLGYSGGANRGLRAAFLTSPWAILITNDCQLLQLPKLPPSPGLYAATLLRKDGVTIESVGGAFDALNGHLRHLKSVDEFYRHAHGGGSVHVYVPGHCFLLHQSVFEKYGGFDESLFTYWEDVDLSMRYMHNHVPVRFLADLQVAHAGGKTCRKDRKYSAFYFQRNRRIMLDRYSPRPLYSRTLWTKDLLKRSLKCALKKDWEGLKHNRRALVG